MYRFLCFPLVLVCSSVFLIFLSYLIVLFLSSVFCVSTFRVIHFVVASAVIGQNTVVIFAFITVLLIGLIVVSVL